MTIRTRPPRTISDIKTHSGRVSREHQTYRDFFQLGALELERWRREREREAASRRIAGIDSRIADIDKEKNALLTEAGLTEAGVFGGRDKRRNKPDFAEQNSSGIRIKY